MLDKARKSSKQPTPTGSRSKRQPAGASHIVHDVSHCDGAQQFGERDVTRLAVGRTNDAAREWCGTQLPSEQITQPASATQASQSPNGADAQNSVAFIDLFFLPVFGKSFFFWFRTLRGFLRDCEFFVFLFSLFLFCAVRIDIAHRKMFGLELLFSLVLVLTLMCAFASGQLMTGKLCAAAYPFRFAHAHHCHCFLFLYIYVVVYMQLQCKCELALNSLCTSL